MLSELSTVGCVCVCVWKDGEQSLECNKLVSDWSVGVTHGACVCVGALRACRRLRASKNVKESGARPALSTIHQTASVKLFK